jgi:osmotically-inducible protein OsmY
MEEQMKIRMTSLGLPAALLAASLFGACSNTARGVQEDTAQNAEKAKEASADAADASKRAAEDAKVAGEHAAEATKEAVATAGDKMKEESAEAGAKSREAAANTANAVDAAQQTTEIKAALIAEKSVDASKINVDTDGATMTVTLKGSVPTASQKAAAERIAKNKAPNYKVVNFLTVG